jgi:hypothetical protein
MMSTEVCTTVAHQMSRRLLYTISELVEATDEVSVDDRGDAGSGAGGDDELLRPGRRGLPCGVEPGHRSPTVVVDDEQAVGVEVGAEQRDVLELAGPGGTHEAALAGHDLAVGELDAGEAFATALQGRDGAAVDADPAGGELRLLGLGHGVGGPVREDDEVLAPLRQQQGALREVGVLADDGEGLVALAVPVALDAAVDERPVERAQPVDRRQVLARRCAPRNSQSTTNPSPARLMLVAMVCQCSPSSYARNSSRPSLRSSSGEMPSRVRYPCDSNVAELRGRLLSTSSTRRRARTRFSAALRPAGPPPTTTTSQ